MGAVIGMDGRRADRKQMFDIGLAGPLAGLAVAIPILLVGIHHLDSSSPGHGPFRLDLPLVVRSVLAWNPPPGYHVGVADADQIWFSHLNPFFMAGWVGLLVTGLNMLPVSQLDGGHVSYALFGRRSRWVAYGFMLAGRRLLDRDGDVGPLGRDDLAHSADRYPPSTHSRRHGQNWGGCGLPWDWHRSPSPCCAFRRRCCTSSIEASASRRGCSRRSGDGQSLAETCGHAENRRAYASRSPLGRQLRG